MRRSLITAMVLLTWLNLSFPLNAQRPQTDPKLTQVRRLPRNLTEAKLKTHVIAPENIQDVEAEEVDPAREVTVQHPPNTKKYNGTPKLNVTAFAAAVHADLKDSVAGYIMQVRQNGVLVYTNIWKKSQTSADQNKVWNENTRMHVASVSKYVTAVGLVKLLQAKGISYDATISQYLPAYWHQGSQVNQITFRHLLTHHSGFTVPGSKTDFQTMKSKVAAGVSNVGDGSGYENMNYGLMRILIAVINGDIDRNTEVSQQSIVNDVYWDAVTIGFYHDYIQDHVFDPAGVHDVWFFPLPGATGSALAYPFPELNIHGWNSGDLSTVSGAAGWRLSIKELLDVMNSVRRKNTIIDSTTAQYMLDNHFGIDQTVDTPAGKIYNKNGGWTHGSSKEQSVAYFFPDGMEVAIFVNSPTGRDGFSLRNTIRDAFMDSLQ